MSTFTGTASSEPQGAVETSDIILVAGATGGVGRRVVNILRERGYSVRALVSFHMLSYFILLEQSPIEIISFIRFLLTNFHFMKLFWPNRVICSVEHLII